MTLTIPAAAQALSLIAASRACERSTAGIDACFDAGRTADALFGCDRACAPCIANRALTGQPIPTGVGAEGERHLSADYYLHVNHHYSEQQDNGVSRTWDPSACTGFGCRPVVITLASSLEEV